MHITKQNYNTNGEVVLFINGQFPIALPDLNHFQKIYCTDGAYKKLKLFGVKPHVVSGDFDSVNLDEVDEETTVIPTPDQDFTDFEKALQLIANDGFSKVNVYGCSGLEQDHFLGNVHSMSKFKDELEIVCFDDFGFYFFAAYETYITGFENEIISLFPFPKAKNIVSEGVLYPLYKEDLSLSDRVGTRNTITHQEVKITFTAGNLLLFIQHKK
ncbi:thiamine diphosphokinase [Zhouia sp. PK063]|uniref:thiamine diphosphokinase n=1 Tax=Zhouia sp. PK063 TaxID=3373602 RepID=UPI00379AB6D4